MSGLLSRCSDAFDAVTLLMNDEAGRALPTIKYSAAPPPAEAVQPKRKEDARSSGTAVALDHKDKPWASVVRTLASRHRDRAFLALAWSAG